MSRFRRVVHSTASGFVLQAATALYALASVPLALFYLSKERFALWALMGSIGGYLSLIDLGMSGSVARLLIDHKDDRERGAYGSLLLTGWLVLIVQAVILFVVGVLGAPLLCALLDIQADLQTEFISLMRWQSASLALGLALRISTHLLFAHQRLDVFNYTQLGSLAANFALMWFFFWQGYGVFSLVWASLLSSLLGANVSLAVCARLDFFPARGAWGKASWQHFREIFAYGKDLFLVAVGTQLIMASQTMIITRRLGLQAAAAWAVGTRAFALVSQAVWRVSDVSGPAFAEMMARGEHMLLRERYKAVLILTASLGGFSAVIYALCNSAFVSVWTHGKFVWPPDNDVLLAIWLIVTTVLHVHNMFVLLTRQIGFMRYIYFLEGVCFVALAFLAAKRGGLPSVILCSIICSAAFSGAYGIWRVSRYFGCSIMEVGFGWMAPMARGVALFAPAALACWWIAQHFDGPLPRLAFNGSVGGLLGLYLLLRHGLPHQIQRELLHRAPKWLVPALQLVLVSAPP